MRLLRFFGLLLWRSVLAPVGGMLALPVLLVGMILLGSVYFVMKVWADS